MSSKTVKRLMGLEIDEVSLVDRPANQHGLVAITKRAEDTDMPQLFDADNNPVDETDLQVGDFVYDESGAEFQYLDDDAIAELEDQGAEVEYADQGAYDQELAGVGKAFNAGEMFGGLKRGLRGVAGPSRNATEQRATQTGSFLRRNRRTAAIAGVGGVGGGTGAVLTMRNRGVNKSLGESVLEELSKALTDDDRNTVIAKAMDRAEQAEASAAEAWQIAKSLQDEREFEQCVEIAKSYGVPGDPEEIAELIFEFSKSGNQQALDTLHRTLSASGEIFDQIGYDGGYSDSPVLDNIQALALETVGKAADLSMEQATVALFDANPDAYDEYLRDQR